MPPPTVTLLIAAPPQISPPTYTIKQLLAYQPPMPSPPAGVSVAILAANRQPPHPLLKQLDSRLCSDQCWVLASDHECSNCGFPLTD